MYPKTYPPGLRGEILKDAESEYKNQMCSLIRTPLYPWRIYDDLRR